MERVWAGADTSAAPKGAKVALRLSGSEGEFLKFVEDYRGLIERVIPGDYSYDHDSLLYIIPSHRQLESVVEGLPPGGRVLDLGCGRGIFSAYLASRGLKVEGIEVKNPGSRDDFLNQQDFQAGLVKKYPSLLKAAGKKYGCRFKYYDGKNLPFKNSSFDGVLFYATYEHIPLESVEHLTRECARVLKPEGKMFIYRCPSSWAWKEHLTQLLFGTGHEKLYGKKEIFRNLRQAGFYIEQFSRSDFFPAFPISLKAFYNRTARYFLALEKLLLWTPLRLFFHHYEIRAARLSQGKHP